MLNLGKRTLIAVALVTAFAQPGLQRDALAASLSLPNSPLLSSGADPNLILTLDESGSMAWGYLPDSVDGTQSQNRYCSSNWNRQYYNPNVRYLLPVDASGAELSTSFNAARDSVVNPYTNTSSHDLTSGYSPFYQPGNPSPAGICGQGTLPTAPFYYTYNSGTGTYSKVTVSGTSGPGTFDLNNDGVVDALDKDERLNFAIWYSFYRTRMLMAKTVIGRVFAGLPSNVRLSGAALTNTAAGNFATGTGQWTTAIQPLTKFAGAGRTNFYQALYNADPSGRTPLRSALERAGNHFSLANANSPYRITPGDASSPELSCRQNFHLLVTDGYWNTQDDTIAVNPGNKDGTSGSFSVDKWIGGDPSYTPMAPYSDGSSNTLADFAMRYWMTDLRPDLANDVPKLIVANVNGTEAQKFDHPANDPAYWQHMVNFTIAMGLEGTLNPDDYTSALKKKSDSSDIVWPAVAVNDNAVPEKLDDLWHAAVDSRGRFFSAKDPENLMLAFESVIENVGARSGAASAASVNSHTLNSNTRLYQSYWEDGWAGHIKSYTVDQTTGAVSATAEWDGANGIAAPASRVVLTLVGTGGAPFRWTNLNTAQQNLLADDPATAAVENTSTASTNLVGVTGGQNRVNFLRGDRSLEDVVFRARASVLGDFVNSGPALAYNDNYGYRNDVEGASNLYSSFVASKTARTPIVYIGGNDGMLHGFDAGFDKTTNLKTATAGNEVLAYVPNLVIKNLNRLTNPAYAHRFYVDGTPTVADAFGSFGTTRCGASTSCWRTVLVGGLNKGGQGYYALDVTDPAAFSETSPGPAKTVLWEYSDADLGYSYSQAAIARMANGDWVAIFGNGYNNTEDDGSKSTTGYAYLYIVRLSDGVLIKKLSTKKGSTTTPNGLATPMPVDVDGNGVVDYIYAGDLQGNMWKFNVRSTTPSQWDSAFKDGNGASANPVPLFTAANGTDRAITSRPDVGLHPSGTGYLVYFGTGRFLEKNDNTTTLAQVQRFYAIWDRDTGSSTVVTASPPVSDNTTDLLQQTIEDKTNAMTGKLYRITSDNPITWYPAAGGKKGWFMNLTDAGERVIANPIVRGNRIIFVTAIPGGDSCQGGGSGWLMVLDAYSGSRLSQSAFDVNGDSAFTTADEVNGAAGNAATQGVYASGVQSVSGGMPTGVSIIAGGGKEYIVGQKSDKSTFSEKLNPGSTKGKRISWRQLK